MAAGCVPAERTASHTHIKSEEPTPKRGWAERIYALAGHVDLRAIKFQLKKDQNKEIRITESKNEENEKWEFL